MLHTEERTEERETETHTHTLSSKVLAETLLIITNTKENAPQSNRADYCQNLPPLQKKNMDKTLLWQPQTNKFSILNIINLPRTSWPFQNLKLLHLTPPPSSLFSDAKPFIIMAGYLNLLWYQWTDRQTDYQ